MFPTNINEQGPTFSPFYSLNNSQVSLNEENEDVGHATVGSEHEDDEYDEDDEDDDNDSEAEEEELGVVGGLGRWVDVYVEDLSEDEEYVELRRKARKRKGQSGDGEAGVGGFGAGVGGSGVGIGGSREGGSGASVVAGVVNVISEIGDDSDVSYVNKRRINKQRKRTTESNPVVWGLPIRHRQQTI